MIYRHTAEHDPATVFALALVCCLVFWLALGLLIYEWGPVAGAAKSAGRLLYHLLT